MSQRPGSIKLGMARLVLGAYFGTTLALPVVNMGWRGVAVDVAVLLGFASLYWAIDVVTRA